MSELTPCNHCSLASMRRVAKRAGVAVIVEAVAEGPMAGWTSVRYSDETEPQAFFMELTDHCVC